MSKPKIAIGAGLLVLCLLHVPAVAQLPATTSLEADLADREIVPCSKREARMHHDTAERLSDAGRTKEAIVEDLQAMYGDPDRAGYQIFMASLLTDDGQLNEALDVYEHVIRRFPQHEEVLHDCVVQLRSVCRILSVQQLMAGDTEPPNAQAASAAAPIQKVEILVHSNSAQSQPKAKPVNRKLAEFFAGRQATY